MNNLIQLQVEEKITAILPIKEYSDTHYVTMVTKQGVIKRVSLTEFSNPRRLGVTAIHLDDKDVLVNAKLTDGKHDVMLFNSDGKAIRFAEDEVRAMGRQARGVRGMRLDDAQSIIAMLVAPQAELTEPTEQAESLETTPAPINNDSIAQKEPTLKQFVLCATENGFGKITDINDFTKHHRGGSGVIAINSGKRNGKIVGACLVSKDDEVMLITDSGVMVRTAVQQIRQTGRSAQGVVLINLDEQAKLSGIYQIVESSEEIDAEEI